MKPPVATPLAILIGWCFYCGLSLFDAGPTTLLDAPLSHVGCAVHAQRTGQRG